MGGMKKTQPAAGSVYFRVSHRVQSHQGVTLGLTDNLAVPSALLAARTLFDFLSHLIEYVSGDVKRLMGAELLT